MGILDAAASPDMTPEAEDAPALLGEAHPYSGLTREYLQTLLKGDRGSASRLVLAAADNGMTVKDIYLHVFQPAQYEIGNLWQTNKISVAQEHFCTAATQLIMSQLYPRIFSGNKNGGTIVATCVSGELHEIGVRMVADFFEMDGWNSYYLGSNTPFPDIVDAVVTHKADVLAVGVTITCHVPEVEQLIRATRQNPACAVVKILVGGYPFNIDRGLAAKIGADGSASDAASAIALAREWVGKSAA